MRNGRWRMLDDERLMERRLEVWGAEARGDMRASEAILDEVLRVRAARQRAQGAFGLALVAVVTAARKRLADEDDEDALFLMGAA